MPGERYADRAVATLGAYVEANLPAALRVVETEQGLASGSLTDPVAYVKAIVPDDGRSPLVETFCNDGAPIDLLNDLYSFDCTIALTFAGDAQAENNNAQMYRYMSALLDIIRTDEGRQIGDTSGAISAALDNDQSFFAIRGSDQGAMYALTLGVEVRVHES